MDRCPIQILRRSLIDHEISDATTLDAVDADVQRTIKEAVEFAKQAPYPDPSEVYNHVYA